MLEIKDMPGPTDQARVLQHKQYQAHDAMYDTWNLALERVGYDNRTAASNDSAYVAAKAAYEATVAELEALLGPGAHCNEVDCDLWSLFSDCFKSDNGIRPRFHKTRASVLAYLDQPQTASVVD